MKPVFDIDVFRSVGGVVPSDEGRRSREALRHMMTALININVDILRYEARHGNALPVLYRSGIRYQREPPGREWWQDIYVNFKRRNGDCEDLACHRAAELRVIYNREAVPFITWRMFAGDVRMHALVMVKGPDGWRIEDPSRKLGMGWENGFGVLNKAQILKLSRKLDVVQKQVSPGVIQNFHE